MSLDPIQIDVVKLLKNRRSAESFVGGSTIFNKDLPRRSADMDIYVETISLHQVAADDVVLLRQAGFEVEVRDQFYGLVVEAKISRNDESTLVEWNEADRERFFPVTEDAFFGWTLHPVDQAVQKLVAAAARREARDCVDIVLLDRFFAPLSALAMAAPAKLAGASPLSILDRALRNGIGLPQQDFEALALDREAMPFGIGNVKTVLVDAIDKAHSQIVSECDEADPAYVYCAPGTMTLRIPRNEDLPRLTKRGISERGLLPILDRNRRASAPSSSE